MSFYHEKENAEAYAAMCEGYDASAQLEILEPGTGKFKDASIHIKNVSEIDVKDLRRWLKKAQEIQWDYKNIYKRKGKLIKLTT